MDPPAPEPLVEEPPVRPMPGADADRAELARARRLFDSRGFVVRTSFRDRATTR